MTNKFEILLSSFGFRRLLGAIRISEIIMQQSAVYLLFQNDYPNYNQFFVLNEEYPTYQSLPQRRLLSFNDPKQSIRKVYIYNPTDQRRIEIVTVLLDTYQVQVTSHEQSTIQCQIDPKWSDKRSNIIDQNQFEVRLIDFLQQNLHSRFLSYSFSLMSNHILSKNIRFN